MLTLLFIRRMVGRAKASLLVDQNVSNLIALMERASRAGYTHLHQRATK